MSLLFPSHAKVHVDKQHRTTMDLWMVTNIEKQANVRGGVPVGVCGMSVGVCLCL